MLSLCGIISLWPSDILKEQEMNRKRNPQTAKTVQEILRKHTFIPWDRNSIWRYSPYSPYSHSLAKDSWYRFSWSAKTEWANNQNCNLKNVTLQPWGRIHGFLYPHSWSYSSCAVAVYAGPCSYFFSCWWSLLSFPVSTDLHFPVTLRSISWHRILVILRTKTHF